MLPLLILISIYLLPLHLLIGSVEKEKTEGANVDPLCCCRINFFILTTPAFSLARDHFLCHSFCPGHSSLLISLLIFHFKFFLVSLTEVNLSLIASLSRVTLTTMASSQIFGNNLNNSISFTILETFQKQGLPSFVPH